MGIEEIANPADTDDVRESAEDAWKQVLKDLPALEFMPNAELIYKNGFTAGVAWWASRIEAFIKQMKGD